MTLLSEDSKHYLTFAPPEGNIGVEQLRKGKMSILDWLLTKEQLEELKKEKELRKSIWGDFKALVGLTSSPEGKTKREIAKEMINKINQLPVEDEGGSNFSNPIPMDPFYPGNPDSIWDDDNKHIWDNDE